MSLNKVILIGNVGKDPDVKYFDNGNCVANLTLATNERGYTTSNGTQVPERTDWHNIVVRRDNVPFVERYVHRGSQVLVEGKLRYREYEKEGVRRFVAEIVADRIEFFNTGRRPDNSTTTNTSDSNAVAQTEQLVVATPSSETPF